MMSMGSAQGHANQPFRTARVVLDALGQDLAHAIGQSKHKKKLQDVGHKCSGPQSKR